MLDAAIERVEAVTRAHRESLRSSETRAKDLLTETDSAKAQPTEPRVDPIRTNPAESVPAPAATSPATQAGGAGGDPGPIPVGAAPPGPAPSTLFPAQSAAAELLLPAEFAPRLELAPTRETPPQVSSGPEAAHDPNKEYRAPPDEKSEKSKDGPSIEPSEARAQSDNGTATAAAPTTEGRPPLEITELRLCRNLLGFGSFEPLDPAAAAIQPGGPLWVYCEMTGLEYQAGSDGLFRSRLASHIELRSLDKGSVAWEQALPTAEDVCRRRRRDYYVNYRFKLPRALEPGPYQLRLIQTDLVANRTTSKEIPLTLRP